MDAAALTLSPTALNLTAERGLRPNSGQPQSSGTSATSTANPTALPATDAAPIAPVDIATRTQRANDPLAAATSREADQDVQGSSVQANAASRTRLTESSEGAPAGGLSEQELAQVRELSQRDREVRAHEAAHAAAGGALTGSPTYSFARGPDGRLYAVGGEVSIDTSRVAGDPQATIEKARTIIQAATAPASPSTQDLRAAAAAQAMLVEAQAELNRSSDEEEGERDGVEESRADRETQAATSEQVEDERTDATDQRQQLRSEDDENSDARAQFREEAEARVERSQEALREFAQQLQELNLRLARVQQQLIDSGAITPERAIGGLLDTNA